MVTKNGWTFCLAPKNSRLAFEFGAVCSVVFHGSLYICLGCFRWGVQQWIGFAVSGSGSGRPSLGVYRLLRVVLHEHRTLCDCIVLCDCACRTSSAVGQGCSILKRFYAHCDGIKSNPEPIPRLRLTSRVCSNILKVSLGIGPISHRGTDGSL